MALKDSYTFADLIGNLRSAPEPSRIRLDDATLGWTLCAIFGFPADTTEEVLAAYDEFDRACQEAGL